MFQEYLAAPAYITYPYDGIAAAGLPPAVKWSGKMPLPAVGDEIHVAINKIGACIVVGYFVQDGWLGVKAQPLSPPDWYLKQNGGNVVGHVFGAEIKMPAD
jgi:hypothetical protein